jgi:hypothetical protein
MMEAINRQQRKKAMLVLFFNGVMFVFVVRFFFMFGGSL